MKIRILAVIAALVVAAGLLVSPAGAANPGSARPGAKPRGTIVLFSMGSRLRNTPLEVRGSLSTNTSGNNKTVLLQKQLRSGRWETIATRRHKGDGQFKVRNLVFTRVQTTRLRALLRQGRAQLDVSNRIRLSIVNATCLNSPSPTRCPQPAPLRATQTVDTGAPVCDPAGGGTVPTATQHQDVPYVWDPVALAWVPGTPDPNAWVTDSTGTRQATDQECPAPQVRAQLPDLVIQKLDICSPAERQATGTCFRIEHPVAGPFAGLKLLKFPVLTANVGVGPMEINATRPNSSSGVWSAAQTIYNSDGSTTQQGLPAMNFEYSGDGHNHWHIIDFDRYQVLGQAQAVGEKHGYCVDDNSTPHGGPIPGQPADPVYTENTSCGEQAAGDPGGIPAATSIREGMSIGWGDTYPSSLPNQAIDVSSLADGVYTVKVCANQQGLLLETDTSNDCASISVDIQGDTVTPDDTTATGY